MSVLIDSNVFIAAASYPYEEHAYGAEAAELLRLCAELEYQVLISHGTRVDISRSGNRRTSRVRELSKFVVLERIPVPVSLASDAGFPNVLSDSDAADLEVLAAFQAGLGTWLVSNDAQFRRRAKRVVPDPSLVLSLAEANDGLRRLLTSPSMMPAAETVNAYVLNLDATIFTSLKNNYPKTETDAGFLEWWRTKVVPQRRPAIVLGETNDPEGVAVLKDEEHADHGITGAVTKICTLIVADDFAGTKRGEALLKAVVDHARRNHRDTLFVEVLPTVETLPGWLEEFGFMELPGAQTSRGENVFVKRLEPDTSAGFLSPLNHAIRYGPGALLVERAFLVPVQDRWHQRLLPEAEAQLSLTPLVEACGNAIRKAYLCRSNSRRLIPGDVVIFLRTGSGEAQATSAGVVESVCVSSDPNHLAGFVGTRTVYSMSEIESLCSGREVLAIRFRFDRVLPETWSASTLRSAGVMVNTPQSVTQVRSQGVSWIRTQLGV